MDMKAQFYILGAVILLALMFSSISFYRPLKSETQEIEYIAENIANEHPKALNLILKSGSPSDLADFTNFLLERAYFKAIWLVTERQGNNLSVTIGNFLGEQIDVKITVGASSQTATIPESSTSIMNFESVPSEFALKLEWNNEERAFNWLFDKTNLFVQINMKMGDNLIRKELAS